MIRRFWLAKVGDHGEVPGAEVYWMQDFDKWVRLSFYSLIADTDDGYVIVNTGLVRDLTLRNKFLREWAGSDRCKFTVNENEKIENILKRLNLAPDDVSHVVITPVQDYNVGNLDLFKKAKIYFSRRGWFEDVVNPKPSPFLNRDIYLPKYVREYLFEDAWDRIVLLDDEDEVVNGMRVKWTGCHHRSSMTIILNTKEGTVCFSDAAFTMRNVLENIPIGIAEDIYECLNAYEYLRKTCKYIIPAYDPENMKRYSQLFI
nr:MAG: Zn-dependent hydrolase [Vulcanisaeta sp. AZ3]